MVKKIVQIYNNLNSLNITSSHNNCVLLAQSMNLLNELYEECLNSEKPQEDIEQPSGN